VRLARARRRKAPPAAPGSKRSPRASSAENRTPALPGSGATRARPGEPPKATRKSRNAGAARRATRCGPKGVSARSAAFPARKRCREAGVAVSRNSSPATKSRRGRAAAKVAASMSRGVSMGGLSPPRDASVWLTGTGGGRIVPRGDERSSFVFPPAHAPLGATPGAWRQDGAVRRVGHARRVLGLVRGAPGRPERAGLFDVSHMGEIRVKGPKAFETVQRLTCNDVAALDDGKVQYSAFLTPQKGTFVDDLLTYRIASDDYLLVVNASNTPKDVAWAKAAESPRRRRRGRVADLGAARRCRGRSPRRSSRRSRRRISEDHVLPIRAREGPRACPRSSRARATRARTGSRSTSTPPLRADVWDAILKAGQPHGILPAGLGARDTLRLEACLALYGNDIDDAHTPWEANLGWIVKMKKGDFNGRDALAKQKEAGVPRKLVGFEVTGRGIARHGYAAHGGRRRGPRGRRHVRDPDADGRQAHRPRLRPRGQVRARDGPDDRRARPRGAGRRRADPVLQAPLADPPQGAGEGHERLSGRPPLHEESRVDPRGRATSAPSASATTPRKSSARSCSSSCRTSARSSTPVRSSGRSSP
jgi:aminomethyltransferase